MVTKEAAPDNMDFRQQVHPDNVDLWQQDALERLWSDFSDYVEEKTGVNMGINFGLAAGSLEQTILQNPMENDETLMRLAKQPLG